MTTTRKIIAATLTVASLAAAPLVLAHQGGGGWGWGGGCGAGYGQGAGPGPGYGMGPGHGMGPGYGMMGPGFGRGPGAGMMGPGFGMGFDSPAVLAARLGDFKTALKITAEQEPAWQKYEAAVRQVAETRQTFHAAMQAQMQDPKATIDHAAQHEAMGKLFATQQTARAELYAVLTPEQKALADQQMRPGFGRRMWSQAPAR